jgi:hypothetical protein
MRVQMRENESRRNEAMRIGVEARIAFSMSGRRPSEEPTDPELKDRSRRS